MSFDARNAAWLGKPREFRQSQTRSSSPRVWKVWVNADTVFYEWGQLGGAMQTANEKGQVTNKGKKNEISAEDYALYLAREKCRKKHWEGYREVDQNGEPLDHLAVEIDFANPPLNLCYWKPDNSPGAGILKKAEAKKLLYARKMNGLMFPAWCDENGRVFLTSRRMLPKHHLEEGTNYTWNDRFPHLIQSLSTVMPPKSCLLGELVAFDKDNKDNLRLVESYEKSLTPEALAQQAKNGWAHYYVWDVAFWDEQDLVKEAPVRDRYELIQKTFASVPYILPVQVVRPGEYEGYETIDDFRRLAKEWGWEGFIGIDPDGIFEDRAYNFKGKPDRPGKYAAKVKPEYEDDFIVFWNPAAGFGEFSTKGRYGANGVKSVCLYQLNTKGELVYIANCASGLTEEMKSNLKPSETPLGVWKIIYTDRRYQSAGDDTNAIDFPRFDSIRTDKKIEECVNERL